MDTIAREGHELLAAGISCIPIKTDGSKQPALATWDLFKQERPPAHCAAELFSGNVGLAVVGGAVSGGLEVLDIDEPGLFEEYAAIVEEMAPGLIGRLPHVQTPRPADHLYFRSPACAPRLILAREHGATGPKVRIETRGEGNYAITAPSPAGCHPNRHPYLHVGGPALSQLPTITAAERDVLLAAARTFNRVAPKEEHEARAQSTDSPGKRPGDDYNQRATWPDVLAPHGWTEVRQQKGTTFWRRPGKDGLGVSATTGRCTSEKSGDLFYVFTSNASPFESERAYSKFQAFTLLNHDGNHSQAAAALAEAGYGERQDAAQECAEWPEADPIPGGLRPVPALPECLLPEVFRGWIFDVAERMQCAPEYPTVAALVGLSSLIGRRSGIRPKAHDDWTVIPNLWGGVVGPPGELKTPALREGLAPLERLATNERETYEKQLEQQQFKAIVAERRRKGLEREIDRVLREGGSLTDIEAEMQALEGTEPVLRRYVVNDATVEKLGEILRDNANGVALFRDELPGWLRSLDREGHEADRAFYLEAWDGAGSFTYDRIGRGTVHIKAAVVSVLGGIQPGPLATYMRGALKGGTGNDGLMQRFQLLLYPDPPRAWRNVDRWPDSKARDRAFAIFEAVEASGYPKAEDELPFARFNSPAQELFDEWRGDLERRLRAEDEHPAFVAHLAKYRSLMPSLALVLHVAESGGTIPSAVPLRAAELAAGWCDLLEAHARRVYQLVIDQDAAVARLLGAKLTAGRLRGPFVARDVYKAGWAGLTERDDVERALAFLVDLGWLRSVSTTSGTGGRPSIRYLINPAIAHQGGGE